jgi:hypothetical protein
LPRVPRARRNRSISLRRGCGSSNEPAWPCRSFGVVVVAGCFREEQKGRIKKLNANG